MDGQRQRSGGHGRRRKRSKPTAKAEPILIAARRPNAPRLGDGRNRSVASAPPKSETALTEESAAAPIASLPEPATKRTARIVALSAANDDAQERLRSKLLDRLIASEGRSAITRAARDFRDAGFEFPIEQRVQLQLLEHRDEETVCAALEALSGLVAREAPIKGPVLEQRLRRLEEYADDDATRVAAADLRRLVRARSGGASATHNR